jgi:tetratricopeptide (TPR) repeat protein
MVGNKLIPANVRQDIRERTDGIPLFVEEMTKAVLEAASESEALRTIAAAPSPARSVPASLQASLMARLDRLGSAKEVAQIGAAIGREFSHALLTFVARKPDSELSVALDRLVSAGLLFRQSAPPHAIYLFKHALVQDAAYGTLLRDPRRAIHARIVDTLETKFPEIAENQPELLARHSAEAGLIEKAAHLWGEAGQRSVARSAYHEAIEQLTQALTRLGGVPSTPALRREVIKLQIAQIAPLYHAKGFAAPETRAAAERAQLLIDQAESLGEPPEDPLLLFSVLNSFWAGQYVAFDGDAMCALALRILALAENQAAAAPRRIGHLLMGMSLMLTGSAAESVAHLDQAIALYDPALRGTRAAGVAQDDSVSAALARAWAKWFLGYPDKALGDAESALKVAREIGQAGMLMYALGNSLIVQILCGNQDIAVARAQEQTALAEEKGASFWKAFGLMNCGRSLDPISEPRKAIELINTGITMVRATGAKNWLPFYFVQLARAYLELGQFQEAWHNIDEALTAVETTKEKWCEPEVLRMAGEIALSSPERDEAKAEGYFERALEIARAQQAKSWELRAAMSMARLWRDQNRKQQACDLLAGVYGWFTEGFETLDLKEARGLLDTLGA